jgi:hypothetical protein
MIRIAIYQGKLPAVDWGNYFILKSRAIDPDMRFRKYIGSGGKGQYHLTVTPAAKAFMVLAEAVGLMQEEIGALMGWKEKRVDYFLRRLHREGVIPKIIREHGLKVGYDRATGKTFASWRVYAHRFPRLARIMESGRSGRSFAEKKQMTIVERKANRWGERVRKRLGLAA